MLKNFCFLLIIFFFNLTATAQEKYRVVIMTDMTHDDGNSLIRYLYYAHHFDTEAIIITPQLPDFPYDSPAPWEKANRILDAYQQELSQLSKHHSGYPAYQDLKQVTHQGRGAVPIIWLTNEKKFDGDIAGRKVTTTWGDIKFSDWIGEGNNPNGEPKDSEGSDFLQEVFAKDDDRPIFVQMWGGPITFIQALYRYRQKVSKQKFQQLLDKLHIFGILLQDITFDYLINLDKVQELNCANMGTVKSTYSGERVQPRWLLHDAGHFWKYITVMKQEEVNGHGPMSELYDHGGEGDTPSFLYLLSAQLGLNDPLQPTQGSWGSRFVSMGEDFPSGYYHTCGVDVQHLTRWVDATRNSFLNRLNYSLKNPEEVNHEPVAVVNGNTGNQIIRIKARPGLKIKLDASHSSDPDGDRLQWKWFNYLEAGTYPEEVNPESSDQPLTSIIIPEKNVDGEIHLVLELKDTGNPPLVSYRRIIVEVK